MPDQPLTSSQAALRVGVSINTIRRWCKDHAQYLSPGANPERGASRSLTENDIEVLRNVVRLHNVEGLTAEKVNERLAELVLPKQTVTEVAQDAPGGPGWAMVPAVVIERIHERLDALESERRRTDMVFVAVAVFVAGLIIGLAM